MRAHRRGCRAASTTRLALVATAALCLALPATAAATLPQQQGRVDLLDQANVLLDGVEPGPSAGTSVAAAGDVNGDGLADVVVGAPLAFHGRSLSGSAFVVFGRASDARVDLTALGAGGFRIDGAKANDKAGEAVSGAGDVNADGLADVVVGARSADPSSRTNAGSAWVVFGKATSATVDLNALGAGGFRIDGAVAGDAAGTSVGRAGDLNGDGYADVVVGAPAADFNARSSSGSAYVVLGSAASTTVDLAALGARGRRIDGVAASDQAGWSVAGAGDLDGDGRPDVVVGSRTADRAGASNTGAAHVLTAPFSTTTIDLAALGSGGFRIDGAVSGDEAGYSVAGAGDVNGDGRADVVVGAPFADDYLKASVGTAHVVFGKATSTSVDLDDLGTGGFRILGVVAQDRTGMDVAGAGDVNGDGRPDVVVSSRYAGRNDRFESGGAYVVFGKATSVTVDLNAPDAAAFRIDGGAAGDLAGNAVAGAGDVNGDGRSDVLLGAPGVYGNAADNAGAAYVAYGFGAASVVYSGPVTGRVGQPIGASTPVVRRTGAPRFSVAPALPDGLTLDALTGVVSGTPARATDGTYTVTMTDLSGSATAPLRVAIADVASPAPPPAPPPPPLPACVLCGGATGPVAPPILDSAISVVAKPTAAYTTFTALLVRKAHAGSTIRVTCSGRGCLFATNTRRVRRETARLDLSAVVRRSRLRPRAKLEIRVTQPGMTGIVRRFTVRAKLRPARQNLCLAPGSTRPARCAA